MQRGLRRRFTKDTPQTPYRKVDTTAKKVTPGRNPIKNKLPREDNHFRGDTRLPNLGNCLQGKLRTNTDTWEALHKVGISRFDRVPTILAQSTRPPILPVTAGLPRHHPKQLRKQIILPNKQRPPPPKVPNPVTTHPRS